MYEVGQTLFVQFTNNRKGQGSMTITKVGRKWLELDGGRFRACRASLLIDGHGYSSPGQCYVSRDAWEREFTLRQTWSNFRRVVGELPRPPDGATPESIQRATEILGI